MTESESKAQRPKSTCNHHAFELWALSMLPINLPMFGSLTPVYLTSIMDLYSRKIIVWNLSKTMEVSCVIDTVLIDMPLA